jgi:hypothetical protein
LAGGDDSRSRRRSGDHTSLKNSLIINNQSVPSDTFRVHSFQNHDRRGFQRLSWVLTI